MMPLDKCPVCGGEVVKREVKKIVRGGNLTEILETQSEVCLRCGERFYAPETIKRFKEIRAKLEDNETIDAQNISSLLTKIVYELWFLDFMEKRYDMIQGKADPPVIEITSGNESFRTEEIFEEALSSYYNTPVINAIIPLTFLASFKALDMIIEWILEKNSIEVPRPFMDKVKRLKKASDLPSLFERRPYLYQYSKALFCQLVPYRNEVIHKNSFAASEGTLTISSSKQGTILTLSSKQVNSLVRFVYILIRALLGRIIVDDHKENILRYDLDILEPVHGLNSFNQKVPSFVHVVFNVPKQGTAFPADLKQVRDILAHKYPIQEVIFDLKVYAMEGENLIAQWYFAPEEIPDLDVMVLYEESHKKHRVALVK